MAISYMFIRKILRNLTPILPHQRIEKLGQISSTDFYFTLSKTRDHAFFISLNPAEPFVGLVKKSLLSHQTTNPFFQALKKALDHAFIHSLELLDSNRVMCIRMSTTSPAFVTEQKSLYIELIPQHPNLILVDEHEKILLVFRPRPDLNTKRPLLRQIIYTPPEPQFNFSQLSQFEKQLLTAYPQRQNLMDTPTLYRVGGQSSALPSTDDQTQVITLHQWVEHYLQATEMVRMKQRYAPLFSVVKKRTQTLEKKLSVLKREREQALTHLLDIDKGNTLLTYHDTLEVQPSVVFEGMEILLDTQLSIIENANRYFKLYRKAKQALVHTDVQTRLAQEELSYLQSVDIHLQNATGDEAKTIERELTENGYLSQKIPSNKPIEVTSKMPYFVYVNQSKIGFGHNHFQNDYLTFSLAKPNHYFLHTLHYPGAHVVILDENPQQVTIKLAASIALKLSKLTSGEVMIARKKDVKKLGRPGQVKVEYYQSLRIVELDGAVDALLATAIRAT